MNQLIVGCGYMGQRVAALLPPGKQIFGLVRSQNSAPALIRQNIQPIIWNLQQGPPPQLPSQNASVYYFAPPPKTGREDTSMQHFLDALEHHGQPQRIVYISTTGVYGNCQGAWVNENHPTAPKVDRALRRLNAENQLFQWAAQQRRELVILRVAGIYGPGKLPLKRLRAGAPMVDASHAPWTNRIHADDLTQVCIKAMQQGRNQAIYNVSDGHPGNMRDYFNRVAEQAGLPRPPLIEPEQAQQLLSAGMRSYLAESRRIDNRRMLEELDVELKYPTLAQGLESCFKNQ